MADALWVEAEGSYPQLTQQHASLRIAAELLGLKQNVVDQFSIAMDLADNHPVGAAIIGHGAYRSIGRDLDQRGDKRFDFLVISSNADEMSLMSL